MNTADGHRLTRDDFAFFGLFALAKILISATTMYGYGYFRDEMYYIDCAKHLAWGYVDHPPLSIAILAVWRAVFGDSMLALRFPAILAGACSVVLAGLIAREMGGKRFAQGLACLCVLFAPIYLAMSTFFSMNAFDQMFWTLMAYVIVRMINRDDPRMWLWFGVVAGFGLLNKISVTFFGFGIVVAMLFTPHRKYFLNRYLWFGGAIAFLIFLPHLIWQVLNDWPTLEFTHNAAVYKNAPQGLVKFLLGQLLLLNPLAFPIWIGGLVFGLFCEGGKRYRWLSLAYVVVFLLLSLTYGKDYYLSPAYPMLFALGAISVERLSETRRVLRPIVATAVALSGIALLPLSAPVLPIETFLAYARATHIQPPRQELSHTDEIPQHFGDRFGWPEMVEFVAKAYDALPEADRAKCAIYADNYGEAAAINFFGSKYGLPRAISGHNNYFLWGPGDYTGEVVLVFNGEEAELTELFKEVKPLGVFTHPYAMHYENDSRLFLCRGIKAPFNEIWPSTKKFI
ncbi:MAG: glycosyltransferase family 39 protein [Candidatus Hydrogenedentes bacterium]|nr:glycosyltransferase family 39 protein [Candidatus Hydrogenedentota bacterium]